MAAPRPQERFVTEELPVERLRAHEMVAQKRHGHSITPGSRNLMLGEALCYRLTLPDEAFGARANEVIGALEQAGYSLKNLRDFFHERRQPQYKEVVAWLTDKEGGRFRLELHTALTRTRKQRGSHGTAT